MVLADKSVSRRGFLRGAAALAVGGAALPALQGLGFLGEQGRIYAAPGNGSYGDLSPVADLRDGASRISLPKGFKYRSFSVSKAGETMSDGNPVPLAHDGMAGFNMHNGTIRLVRNHEDRNLPGAGSVLGPNGTKYDQTAGGGTTTLVVDPGSRELISHFVSLNGTIVNCAGGLTPWDSWLTCEETTEGTGEGWLQPHGYCFDVPVDADSAVPAIALKAMGRFAHEAVAVDPRTGIVYETEDAGATSGFYRFIPNTPGVLADGGMLQMLAIVGQPGYNTGAGHTHGDTFQTTWDDIADPDPASGGESDVFNQGLANGGAAFARLEGCWYADGAIYFVSTSGGAAGAGQVWEYRIRSGALTLIFESPSADVLDAPDNLTVTPHGALLLCEDGGGEQFLRGVTLNGEIFDFAENVENGSEWAGATFVEHGGRNGRGRGRNDDDNDGNSRGRDRGRDDDDNDEGSGNATLFVNRQGSTSGTTDNDGEAQGMTFAIWGPWKKGAL